MHIPMKYQFLSSSPIKMPSFVFTNLSRLYSRFSTFTLPDKKLFFRDQIDQIVERIVQQTKISFSSWTPIIIIAMQCRLIIVWLIQSIKLDVIKKNQWRPTSWIPIIFILIQFGENWNSFTFMTLTRSTLLTGNVNSWSIKLEVTKARSKLR